MGSTGDRVMKKRNLAALLTLFLAVPALSHGENYTVRAADSAQPKKMKVTQTVYSGSKALDGYTREDPLRAPEGEEYLYADNGIFTFRGNNYRQNAAYGFAQISEGRMEIMWETALGTLSTKDNGVLGGVGWGSQPAVVKWPYEVRQMMNLYDSKKNTAALKEVIFAAQDGKVYFLDLLDGSATRDTISIGYPMKGSVAVDPYSRPMIAFGQAISKLKNGKTGPIGCYVYSLVDQTELFFLNGRSSSDQKQYSTNGAFDGTGLFLSQDQGDAFVIAGENGLLYTVELNTAFSHGEDGSLSVKKDVVYLRSKTGQEKEPRTTVESSLAMAGPYVFTADGWGILRCTDTDTMQILWAADCGDNTDAAVALEPDGDGSLALYTGNTVFDRLKKKKTATARRMDALTGETVWTYDVACVYDKSELSGFKASPVVGQESISDLVIFTANMTGKGKTASVIALDKETGALRWEKPLDSTAVSSPVAVYNEQGNAWIIQADESGLLHLLDGVTGIEISTLQLSGPVQGSPAVYQDILVVGTSGKNGPAMYGIRLR